MLKQLVREEPNQPEDEGDRKILESGKILWRGDTAFTLED
jgi:hypothetical protein